MDIITVSLTEAQTLAVGLFALVVAGAIMRLVPFLTRLNVPTPVIGGLLIAIVVTLIYRFSGTSIQFASKLTDFFLLMFFTTVGLSAKLSSLKAGGRPLLILCAVTIILLVVQNVVGILVAMVQGVHPYYGLLVGSISFVGGPGTAAAWAQEAQAIGIEKAPEVAVGAATLAVICGAMVAGPITGWLVRRHNLKGPATEAPSMWIAPEEKRPVPQQPVSTIIGLLFLIVVAVVVSAELNDAAREAGVVLPGFLIAMLVGVAITNVSDAIGANINLVPIERVGEVTLQAFLAMYLMSLKIWTLGAALEPLLINVVLQVVVTTLIGILLLFRWLGRDYDAAVTFGGFLGFGLSSMPVAMATMDSVALRYGPSPKAFLLVTLAGSFFVDLANAFIVKGFLSLPMFD